MTSSDDLIAEFGRKYLWWQPVGSKPHSGDRTIAQAMNFGTYDDILRLEEAIGDMRLVEIMQTAQPGWLNDRSWEFWRGRLTYRTGLTIRDKAPRPAFHASTT